MSKKKEISPYTSFHGSKHVYDYMNKSAFKVHGVDFMFKDIVQAVLYISPYFYEVVSGEGNTDGIDSFMVSINVPEEYIVLTPGKCRKSRIELKDTNSLIINDESTTFFLTIGFLFDNFELQRPKNSNSNKFVVEETGDLVIFRKDIEKLMLESKSL